MTFPSTDITAIPTIYKGINLKSRMEAQCAVLFDKLGWHWKYEPFSFMLPSGIAYTPDFWSFDARSIIECRGYETDRSVRQLDDFVSLIETRGGLPVAELGGTVNSFLIIGPEDVRLYTSFDLRWKEQAASSRRAYLCQPGIIFRCECGWQLGNYAFWCPDCEKRALSAIALTVKQGKIFGNGRLVEDLEVAVR